MSSTTVIHPTSITGDYNQSGYKASTIASDIYHDSTTTLIHPITGDALLASDLDAIKNSIKNIILTPRGSRPFNPEFGSNIISLLFELADTTTEVSIRDEIIKSIRKFEPRVKELSVTSRFQPDRNAYEITLTFSAQYIGLATIEFLLNRIR